MKKLIQMSMLGVGLCFIVLLVTGAGYYGTNPGNPVVSSANDSSQTNVLVGQVWPGQLTNGPVTNVTYLGNFSGKDLAIQFSGQYEAAGSSNIVIQLARNLSGGTPTNATGTGLKLEVVPSWTITGNGTTAVTVCTNLTSYNGTGTQKGAIPYWYLYSISGSALMTLTNYSVYVNNN